MNKFGDFVFVICFFVWIITSIGRPIYDFIGDMSTLNTLLMINSLYLTFYIIIKTISTNRKDGLDIMDFKVGSTKKDVKKK